MTRREHSQRITNILFFIPIVDVQLRGLLGHAKLLVFSPLLIIHAPLSYFILPCVLEQKHHYYVECGCRPAKQEDVYHNPSPYIIIICPCRTPCMCQRLGTFVSYGRAPHYAGGNPLAITTYRYSLTLGRASMSKHNNTGLETCFHAKLRPVAGAL